MGVVQHGLGLGLRELKSIDHQETFIVLGEVDLVLMDLANGTIPLREVFTPGLILLASQLVGDPGHGGEHVFLLFVTVLLRGVHVVEESFSSMRMSHPLWVFCPVHVVLERGTTEHLQQQWTTRSSLRFGGRNP